MMMTVAIWTGIECKDEDDWNSYYNCVGKVRKSTKRK